MQQSVNPPNWSDCSSSCASDRTEAQQHRYSILLSCCSISNKCDFNLFHISVNSVSVKLFCKENNVCSYQFNVFSFAHAKMCVCACEKKIVCWPSEQWLFGFFFHITALKKPNSFLTHTYRTNSPSGDVFYYILYQTCLQNLRISHSAVKHALQQAICIRGSRVPKLGWQQFT